MGISSSGSLPFFIILFISRTRLLISWKLREGTRVCGRYTGQSHAVLVRERKNPVSWMGRYVLLGPHAQDALYLQPYTAAPGGFVGYRRPNEIVLAALTL